MLTQRPATKDDQVARDQPASAAASSGEWHEWARYVELDSNPIDRLGTFWPIVLAVKEDNDDKDRVVRPDRSLARHSADAGTVGARKAA